MTGHLASASGTRERRHKVAIFLLLIACLAALLIANLHLVLVATSSEPRCVAHVQMGAIPAGASGFTAAQSACSPPSGPAEEGAEGKRP
jgi:hypothetical protein